MSVQLTISMNAFRYFYLINNVSTDHNKGFWEVAVFTTEPLSSPEYMLPYQNYSGKKSTNKTYTK